jgi:cell division ATPase FtsA
MQPNKVCRIKEKDEFNLLDPKSGKKQELQTREMLIVFFENLINYVIKIFIREFQKKSTVIDIDEGVEIVISGGTSMAKGFVELFKKVFEENRDNFPIEVSQIRHAADPLGSVAIGNLVYALWEESKNNK